jgi:laminin alpha 1/2
MGKIIITIFCAQEATCRCKSNVVGEHCDRCRPGTIYLDGVNPAGCQPCFCFGLSTECSERRWATGYLQASAANTGWNLTDLYGGLVVPAPSSEGNVEDEVKKSQY